MTQDRKMLHLTEKRGADNKHGFVTGGGDSSTAMYRFLELIGKFNNGRNR